ncbi:MAG: hypothetical protein ACYDHZ_10745 [Dehalococcoidia bacterium]
MDTPADLLQPVPIIEDETPTQTLIYAVCSDIASMLIDKNRKYGDSAISPYRCFSKADPIEQINVRIDDKLSRIMSSQTNEDEDVELDLIGYLILKRVAKRKNRDAQKTP